MRQALFCLILTAACAQSGDAPVPVPAETVSAAPAASSSGVPSAASATATGTASSAGSAAATPTASASAAAPELERPALLDDDGNPLPQTEDEPSVEDPIFQDRMKRLWEAIVKNDPELVRDFFFPVEAYAQVKAIKKPERDWKYRLWKNFVRDIKKYHKRLGKNRDGTKFSSLEIRTEPKWMKPGKEGNLIGYHRVTRSFIHYEDAKGKKRRFDLTSMISWRGHWYVVHLHGFE